MRISSPKTASSTASPRWGSLKPGTQMFLVALVIQLVASVLFAVAIFGSLSTPSGTLTLFLVCFVASTIASALVMILTLVGLFRYRRMTVWNIGLLGFSLLLNPVLWLGLMALA